jgi:DNA mismatch repair protein MutL
MVKKIKILDKKTINQIAAGEVIERPASAVKELLENSIDANSSKIVIELEHAGRKLIRISDDGDGIAPNELKLAFEKHTTNKISKIQDVYHLLTLGFRGEALASIAAVSRVECISCDGINVPGRKLVLEGGEFRSIAEVGSPKGTTIKVKDLFYNLPARYKYLKSDQTELAHIIDVVTHLAIYHHKIGFKVIHNGNELLNFPSTRNHLNNLINIFGKELVRNLIPLTPLTVELTKNLEPHMDNNKDLETGENRNAYAAPMKNLLSYKLSISGYIGKPSITRSDSSYQSFFINGRYVETAAVSNAVKDAYRTLVMKNRYPFVVIFIDIDPSVVDVNISPTKLQIRFENEELVYNKIFTTLRDTLRSHDLIPEAKIAHKPDPISLKAITTFGIGRPGYVSSIPVEPKGQTPHDIGISQKTFGKDKLSDQLTLTRVTSQATNIISQKTDGQANSHPTGTDNSTLPYILPIGQIMDTYIIAESGDGMLIIDQHAASERIMYERISKKYGSNSMSTQELLEPLALELSPKELGLLRTNLGTLKELNFVIDELGNDSYYVKGIPIILGRLQEPEFIHDIINDLISLTKEKEPTIIKDKMIQIMACKAAIKAGKPLNIPEIQQLLRELHTIENPYTCAHGRPTIISLTENQLKKLFKRIV